MLATGKCSDRDMRDASKYNSWMQLIFAWHAANKASQLEHAKLVWGHHLPLRWRNSQTFTSLLIFWAALMCTFPIAAVFTSAWIGFAAGILGVYSICPAGCIFPSKTEQLAVRRMRRVLCRFNAHCNYKLLLCYCNLVPAVNDMCCLCISGAACYWLFCCCQLHCIWDLHHCCGKNILCSG